MYNSISLGCYPLAYCTMVRNMLAALSHYSYCIIYIPYAHTYIRLTSFTRYAFANSVSNVSEGRVTVCQSVSVWIWRPTQQGENDLGFYWVFVTLTLLLSVECFRVVIRTSFCWSTWKGNSDAICPVLCCLQDVSYIGTLCQFVILKSLLHLIITA